MRDIDFKFSKCILMKKKKIFFLITTLKPGGAEIMLKKIIFNLNSNKYSIFVCSIRKKGSIIKEIRPFVEKIFFLNAKNYVEGFKGCLRLRKILIKEKPDIIHCFMVHANLLGRFASIGLKCKVVSSIRVKLIDKKYIPLIILDVISKHLVNYYMVNSKTLLNFYLNLGISRNKIKLIENGIEVEKFKPNKKIREIKDNMGLEKEIPVISMIAHLRKQKDHETMIKALNFLKQRREFIFLMVGDYTPNLSVTLNVRKLIQKYHLKENIKILGLRDDIPEILSITDIWVSSTLYEGQSNSLLEAMLMRKPIVTTNIPENAEVAKNNQHAILVPIRSPKKLAEKIGYLLDNEGIAERLSNYAYKRVKNNYNIQKTVLKLEELYDNLN